MKTPSCPLCECRLRVMFFRVSCSVECVNPNCAFRLDEINEDIILRAVMADHMRPLDEPHAYVAHPDYAGCDAPTGSPVQACGRALECHTEAA